MALHPSQITERWQIRRFVELLPDLSETSLVFDDERGAVPDALLHLGGRIVGIEHTRLRLPPPEGELRSEFEALCNQIADRAQTSYESVCPHPLDVYFDFDDAVKVDRQLVAGIASAVADLVREFSPPVGGNVRLEAWHFEVLGRSFPSVLESLWIHNRAHSTQPVWAPSWGSVVPRLNADYVEERIADKEYKFASYTKRAEETWLLLVMEGGSPVAHMGIEDFPFDRVFATKFRRVYLYRVFYGDVFELRVDHSRTSSEQL